MRVPYLQDGHNSPEVIDVPPGSVGGRAIMANPAADAPGTEGAANVHIVSLAHDQRAQASDSNLTLGKSNKDQRIGARTCRILDASPKFIDPRGSNRSMGSRRRGNDNGAGMTIGFAPEALTTFSHFLISDLMCVA